MGSNPRFLIVDDDRELTQLLTEYFAAAGMECAAAFDGARGLAQALEGAFDLVILDVMLPVLDGFEVLRQIRKRSNIPVIMLTARREREDRIAGLDSGADDYLPKPFDPDELLARANAVLRRTRLAKPAEEAITVGSLSIDTHTRVVHHGSAPLDLTPLEFEILEILVRPPGRVVTRDEISGILHQRPAEAYDRTLDVHISRLRRKLESARIRIRGVRGVGYMLTHEPGGGA